MKEKEYANLAIPIDFGLCASYRVYDSVLLQNHGNISESAI